jgi:hypothetical protein
MSALMTGLNIADEEEEKRGFIDQQIVALFLTIGALIVAGIAVVALAVIPVVFALFSRKCGTVPTIGCVGGAGSIRPTLMFWRSAAAGRARRRESRMNSNGELSLLAAVQSHPQGRRRNRSLVGTRRAGSESPGAGFGLTALYPPQGPRWREVCRARGPQSSRWRSTSRIGGCSTSSASISSLEDRKAALAIAERVWTDSTTAYWFYNTLARISPALPKFEPW